MKKFLKNITDKLDFTNRFGTLETMLGLVVVFVVILAFPAELTKVCILFSLFTYGANKIFVNRK